MRRSITVRVPVDDGAAEAVTNAQVLDDAVLMGTVKTQYEEAKAAVVSAQARIEELEAIDRDLRKRREAW